jgi:transposase
MKILSQIWFQVQARLFPYLEEELGPSTEKQRELIAVLEIARIEEHVKDQWWSRGRPLKDRKALARAYIAKIVYNLPTTKDLIERLKTDRAIRSICGWEKSREIPSESTFCRSFDEFAKIGLPEKVHKELINKHEGDRIVGHISRDSTDITVREKAVNKPKDTDKREPEHKRGRPKKGEERLLNPPSRLKRQREMKLDEILDELPKHCDWGFKKKKGKDYFWKGHKLHIDWADGEIPISCILTSASLHDSQAAIPLAKMSAERVVSLYDLMDSAYDAKEIEEYSRSLGHIALIDRNPRRGQRIEMDPAKKRRYDERSTAERGFSLLKEKFGACKVRVRGHEKVMCHLMFCILALTAERLLNLLL